MEDKNTGVLTPPPTEFVPECTAFVANPMSVLSSSMNLGVSCSKSTKRRIYDKDVEILTENSEIADLLTEILRKNSLSVV